MPSFTVRVELHGVTHQDPKYAELHEAMARQGFSRTIKGDNGAIYELPPAEYDALGDDKQAIRAAAVSAVEEVWKEKFAVLVTQSGGRTWQGLKQLN